MLELGWRDAPDQALVAADLAAAVAFAHGGRARGAGLRDKSIPAPFEYCELQ